MSELTVIFKNNQITIPGNTTLEQFIINENETENSFLVNGEAVVAETILQNYNFIEISQTGTYIGDKDTDKDTVVTCSLCDFTGNATDVEMCPLVSKIAERYEVPVSFKIFRDNRDVTDQTSFLEENDRVFVAPAMGLKGAF